MADQDFSLLPPDEIKTLIFCTGQVYYLLSRARSLNNLRHIAIVRIEQMTPFPFWEVRHVVDFYSASLQEVVWCQEEPYNAGAWAHVEPRLETAMRGSKWMTQVREGSQSVSSWKLPFSKKNSLTSQLSNGRAWQEKLDSLRYGGGLENLRSAGKDRISVRGGRSVRYAGRDQSAAPATGIKKQHKFEEAAFVCEALYGGELKKPIDYVQGVPKF